MKDCDFCRNAHTCDELSHENDLSYISCGKTRGKALRMLFRSGDNRPTALELEWYGEYGWYGIAELVPNYCPFCGRELVENKGYKKGRKDE